MFMCKFNFYFGLVLIALLSCDVSVKAENQMCLKPTIVNSSSNANNSTQTNVQILSGTRVVKGHSYTGWAAVTVRYKNGNKYVERYSNIIIDYGLLKKCIKIGSSTVLEYDSECESLEGDTDVRYYISRRFGGTDVDYILVELAVKQWA